MRTDEQMFDFILQFAKEQETIRAVYMNGSRTNPNVPKDILQDFDIVYVVTETEPYLTDKRWISRFGEITVMQEPDAPGLFASDHDPKEQYAFLMQFEDGNRIDLTLQTVEVCKRNYLQDKLTLPLLDKDHILPQISPPSDVDYHVKKPTPVQFRGCCNEFWWVCPYMAKGLWRKEVLYAIDHLNFYIRPMLIQMLSWKVGIQTDFSISVGKNAKYLKQYLEPSIWEKLLNTYSDADEEHLWNALFAMCQLFSEIAQEVADQLHFEYFWEEEQKTICHLKKLYHREIGQ